MTNTGDLMLQQQGHGAVRQLIFCDAKCWFSYVRQTRATAKDHLLQWLSFVPRTRTNTQHHKISVQPHDEAEE